MVVLALVLLILVVVFSVAIVVSNPAVYDLSLFRVMVPVTSAGVYFTGVGAALLTVVALLLLRLGIRRSRERRQRLKTAEQAAIGGASGSRPGLGPLEPIELADDPDASEPSGPTFQPRAGSADRQHPRRAQGPAGRSRRVVSRRAQAMSFLEIFQPGPEHLYEEKERQRSARRPPFPWWWSAVGHRPRRRHRVRSRCSASR